MLRLIFWRNFFRWQIRRYWEILKFIPKLSMVKKTLVIFILVKVQYFFLFGGFHKLFFPNRKNYWNLTKLNFTIVFLTIQSLGKNFKISQNLLIWHLKKFPKKTSRNTNKSRKIKFFGKMNFTIRFFTPENVGININITKYISLWPSKKSMKK